MVININTCLYKKIPDPKAEDCLFCLSNTNYHESDTNFQK